MPSGGGGGFGVSGTIHAVESPDVAAIAGSVPAPAAARAAVEHPDVAAITGVGPSAILTTQEAADTAALAGGYTAVGTVGAVEPGDIAALSATTSASTLAASERPDVSAISGRFTAIASASPVERPDVASIGGAWEPSPSFTAVEQPDVASMSGTEAVAGHAAAVEARDRPAISGHFAIAAGLSATEAPDRAVVHGMSAGPPPSLTAVEGRDTAMMVGAVSGHGYIIYGNNASGEPIDYSTPIGTTAGTTWSILPPNPGTWSFGVRAFNRNGEEQNIDCVVTVLIDANGLDITNRPRPPMGLRGFPVRGGAIRVEWFYAPVGGLQSPLGFNLYCTAGGSVDYSTATMTVPYPAPYGNAFQANLSGLQAGTQYAVAVRAYNATAEEPNGAFVLVTSPASAPAAVSSLSIVAVV